MNDEPLNFQMIGEAPTDSDTRDLERLKVIVGEMAQEQAQQLIAILWKMRRTVRGAPPLVAAFACLATAESLLLDHGQQLPGGWLEQYRHIAVDLAARVAGA